MQQGNWFLLPSTYSRLQRWITWNAKRYHLWFYCFSRNCMNSQLDSIKWNILQNSCYNTVKDMKYYSIQINSICSQWLMQYISRMFISCWRNVPICQTANIKLKNVNTTNITLTTTNNELRNCFLHPFEISTLVFKSWIKSEISFWLCSKEIVTLSNHTALASHAC